MKYLLIKLVYAQEMLGELYDITLDEREKASRAIEEYAAALGAKALFEDTVNQYAFGHSFACVEHNFPMTHEEKDGLIALLAPFFEDGEIDGGTMNTFNVLSAVRFLQTEGELWGV